MVGDAAFRFSHGVLCLSRSPGETSDTAAAGRSPSFYGRFTKY
jgi:hypothetical protein